MNDPRTARVRTDSRPSCDLRRVPVLPLVIVLLFTSWASTASAHTRSTSSASWEVTTLPSASARVVVRVPVADVQAAVGDPAPNAGVAMRRVDAAALDAYLTTRFVLLADSSPCAPRGAVQSLSGGDATHVAFAWRIACPPGARQLAIRADGFFDALPAHLHLMRVRVDGRASVEHVVVLETRRVPVPIAGSEAANRATGSSVEEFVALGVGHILSGSDHLVFLLALVLVARSLGAVAGIVTGFTVAHSLTLALGVLGWLRPAPVAIEALIGLSIVVVALGNMAPTVSAETRRATLVALAGGLCLALAGSVAGRVAIPFLTLFGVGLFCVCQLALEARSATAGRARWLIAFVFGLVHGFGFAGVLLDAALPRDRLAAALFGFNAGVELGQLLVAALAWPLLRWLSRHFGASGLIQVGSAPVLAAGLYWFLSRSLG